MDSMTAHITDSAKTANKSTNSIPAVIPWGSTKYLKSLDISVNQAFKVALRLEWEAWMTSGEKSFTKPGRMQRASLTKVCQWILNVWSCVKTSTITNRFQKAGLLRDEEHHLCSSESDNKETEVYGESLRLFNLDTEEDDFDGFSCQEEDEEGD